MVANTNNNYKNTGLLAWFRLSLLSILFYVLVSLVMLSLLNFHSLWSVLLESSTGSVDQTSLQPLTDNLLNFLGKLNTPVLMFFWACFGAIVFSIIWVFQNVIFTVGRELDESHYLRNGVVPFRGYWHKTMSSNLRIVIAAAIWIFYAGLYISLLLPWASKLFFVGMYDPSLSRQLIDISVAVIVNAASLYLFGKIQLLLTVHWRSTSS